MRKKEFDNLQRGDIVRQKTGHDSYLITQELGNAKFIGVRTISVTNPQEWDLAVKLNRRAHGK